MRHIDASAVLDLWENYNPVQFPPVWDWIGSEFTSNELGIAKVAFDEVGFRDPDCKAQLSAYGVHGLSVGTPAASEAVAIKAALGIVNEAYGSGVDENDIFIIALAKTSGVELVTNEKLQPNLPAVPRNYMMPAVCNLPSVNVVSISLNQYIRQSGRVFR